MKYFYKKNTDRHRSDNRYVLVPIIFNRKCLQLQPAELVGCDCTDQTTYNNFGVLLLNKKRLRNLDIFDRNFTKLPFILPYYDNAVTDDIYRESTMNDSFNDNPDIAERYGTFRIKIHYDLFAAHVPRNYFSVYHWNSKPDTDDEYWISQKKIIEDAINMFANDTFQVELRFLPPLR